MMVTLFPKRRLCEVMHTAILALGISMLLLIVPVGSHAQEKSFQLSAVNDLHYGEVLFHFYQGELFPSLVKLSVVQAQSKIPNHTQDGQLLKGGLYLAYGMHEQAEATFIELLDRAEDEDMKNQAWFYLGKTQFQRGKLGAAKVSLTRSKLPLSDRLGSEKVYLEAQLSFRQGAIVQAANNLSDWENMHDEWRNYGLYNLGVMAVRQAHEQQAVKAFTRLVSDKPDDSLTKALQDRAQLTAGLYLLDKKRPEDAAEFLRGVRLNSTDSAKALLGLGWAYSELGQYQRALVVWEELATRDFSHPAVQETHMAIAHAYGQQKNYAVAADLYQQTIEKLNQEYTRLETAKQVVRQGQFSRDLTKIPFIAQKDWFWMVSELPDSAVSPYLPELLAETHFVEAVKNYRDLLFMQQNLAHWAESMVSFNDMVAARRARFKQSAPLIQQTLNRVNIDRLKTRQQSLLRRFEVEKATPEGLASPKEQRLLTRLNEVDQRVASLSAVTASPELTSMAQKQAFLQGILTWDISAQYVERRWAIEKSLKTINTTQDSIKERVKALRQARAAAATTFAGFDQRIHQSAQRVRQLQQQVQPLMQRQVEYINQLVFDSLSLKQQRIQAYRQYGLLALAETYNLAGETTGEAADHGGND